MNRIIKEEFGINRKLRAKSQAIQLVEESIYLYNTERPHLSLKMRISGQGYKIENFD
jgi:transposase InsO family protein